MAWPPTAICLLQPTGTTKDDNDGNALSTTDANGNETTFGDNALDQQTTVTQPSPGGKTQTLTDAAGHVTATIDALGRVTATSYDAFGQAAEGYQGQAFNGGSATFHNLALSGAAPAGRLPLMFNRLLERGPGGHKRGPLHLGGRRRIHYRSSPTATRRRRCWAAGPAWGL